MRICVDASIVVKWLISEPGSREALALLGEWNVGVEVWAPDLIWVECASALRRRVAGGHLTEGGARSALDASLLWELRLLSCRDTRIETLAIALETGLIAWDACYVATARALGAELWTADRQMQSRGRRAYPSIHLLTWAETDDAEVAR
jgi:predicted nucleic acid-binding protein